MANIPEEALLALAVKNKGGGGGTSNYEDLENKPQIAGTTLSGNKSLADLGIASASALANKVDKVDGKGLSTNDYTNEDKAIVGGVTAALADKVDKVDGKGLSSNDFTDAYKTAIGANTTAISGIKNGEEINSFGGVESALALKQNATDNSLDTDAKTIVGAINEHEGDISSLKSGFTNLDNEVNGDATVYPYADVITIEDAVPANLADCSVKIEPVQDLHGYDKPWVGGAGKNKLPMTVDSLKALNTDGTWSGNSYTINGITFAIQADNANNVLSIRLTGTSGGGNTYFSLPKPELNVEYIMNGCPSDANDRCRLQWYYYSGGETINDFGNGTDAFTPTNTSQYSDLRISVYSTFTNADLTFHPMIRLATETDATFAPYTNICPISGHTEVDVQRDGKNLFDVSAITSGYRIGSDGKPYQASTYCLSDWIKVKPSTEYVRNVAIQQSSMSLALYDKYKHFIERVASSNGTFTTTSTTTYIRSAILLTDKDTCQIEEGSTATPYEPYQGKTYTIALGDTIYSGTVDFDSGVMTVDKKLVDLGDYTWTPNGNDFYTQGITDFAYNMSDVGAIKRCPYFISDKYASSSTTPNIDLFFNTGYSGYRCFINGDTSASGMTGAEFKEYVTGTHLCYELAAPTTIQLTPQQIQLLKGTNTLAASTGQISVTVNGVAGSIGALTEDVAELSDNFDEVIGWSDRRNLFDAKHVAIEELPNATGTLQYGSKFDVVAGQKYTVSSNMTESLFLFSKTGTDAAVNIFTLTSSKSFSFTAATNTIYYLRNASSTTVDTFRNKLLNGEVQLEEGSVATNYQTFHPIIGNAVDGLIDRVPTAPTTDGTYNLQVTVASGVPTYSWVSGS